MDIFTPCQETVDIAPADVEALRAFIARHPRLFVLTGAGCSTESGIPDYRDADGAWKRSPPVQFADFMTKLPTRQRYWARSLIGWRFFGAARPNAAHRALGSPRGRGPGGPARHAERRWPARAGGKSRGRRSAWPPRCRALHELLASRAPRRAAGGARRAQSAVGRARRARGTRRRRRPGGGGFQQRRRAAVSRLRRHSQARRRVLRRERAARASGSRDGVRARRRRDAGGRLVADDLFGLPLRGSRRGGRKADRGAQPGSNPRRSPAVAEGGRALRADARRGGRGDAEGGATSTASARPDARPAGRACRRRALPRRRGCRPASCAWPDRDRRRSGSARGSDPRRCARRSGFP